MFFVLIAFICGISGIIFLFKSVCLMKKEKHSKSAYHNAIPVTANFFKHTIH